MPTTVRIPAARRPLVLASCLALGLACGLGAGCNRDPAAATAELQTGGARKREIPRVRVTELEQREMVHLLETTSKLESEREIQVFPRASGVVTEILVEEGDPVRTGDVLARLDDRDQALGVREAEVGLEEATNGAAQAKLAVEEAAATVDACDLSTEQAERDYERNQRLFEKAEGGTSILSRSDLETSRLARDNTRAEKRKAEIGWRTAQLMETAAKTSVSRAKVALERAQLALFYTQIVAPFEGVIAERTIRVGDTVSSGASSYVLTDISNLRAVFYRPQEELELFLRPQASGSERLTLTARAEAFPDVLFEGFIERISPTINPDSGQFRVTARVLPQKDKSSAQLLPGMLVRMEIITDRHPTALVVPKRSLRREGERRYILAVDDASVRRVDISEGFSDDEWVEVLPDEQDAILPGDPIVVVGSRDLTDGDPVRVDDLVEGELLPEEQPDEEPDEEPVADAEGTDEGSGESAGGSRD